MGLLPFVALELGLEFVYFKRALFLARFVRSFWLEKQTKLFDEEKGIISRLTWSNVTNQVATLQHGKDL